MSSLSLRMFSKTVTTIEATSILPLSFLAIVMLKYFDAAPTEATSVVVCQFF